MCAHFCVDVAAAVAVVQVLAAHACLCAYLCVDAVAAALGIAMIASASNTKPNPRAA